MDRGSPLRFSMVIPAFNEQGYLPALLETVEISRAMFRGGSRTVEVIVADNGSTDGTVEIARSRGCRVVHIQKRIIAAARNAGAAAARGEILAFVDADSRIHPDTFDAIDQALSNEKVIAGATGVRLERMSPGIALAYMVMVPMVWLTGMDTGVVFCRRKDFVTIGGYDEKRLFAEDVDFLWRLRRLGHSRSQNLIRLTSAKAIASTRKFDQHGDWHYLPLILHALYGMLISPGHVQEIAGKYWYGDQRRN